MYKRIVILLIITLFISACTSSVNFGDEKVQAYGVFNKQSRYNTNYLYEVSARNVIIGILFSSTLVIPVYVIGWELYVPVNKIK